MLYPGNGLSTSNVPGIPSWGLHCARDQTPDQSQQHNLSPPYTPPFALQRSMRSDTRSKDKGKLTAENERNCGYGKGKVEMKRMKQ